MAAVTWQLGRAAIVDLPTAAAALVGAALLFRFRLNSAWLVLAGALLGWRRSSCDAESSGLSGARA